MVLPVYDSKLDSSHSKLLPIRNNLTVNTFRITVEPDKPQQPLNMVTFPIWELNSQNADQPVVEKASSWILKLPKDSPMQTENKAQPSSIFKRECIDNPGHTRKLKLCTYMQSDLIKTENSGRKLQCYTFKADEREGNFSNLKVDKKKIDKDVQVQASDDRSSSLAQDSDECIMKLYICKKSKKSKHTKSGASKEYLNKVYAHAAQKQIDLIRNFQVIEKIRKSLTENSESGDSSVEVCCEELNKKGGGRNNLRRSSEMKMVVRKPSVRLSSCTLKRIGAKKLADQLALMKPPENLQCVSYSTIEKSEDNRYSENKSIQPSSSGCSAERGKVSSEEFRSSCNLFVETPNRKSDLGRSDKDANNSLRSKIPRPRQDFADPHSKKRFSSLLKKSKISNKPPSISSSETSNASTPNFWKPPNKKHESQNSQQKTGSKIPKKLSNLPAKKFSKPITNNEKTKAPKITLKKSSRSSLLKNVTKKLSVTTSSSEKPRRVAQEHQSFQEAEKKQTNGSSNRSKFKRNVSMLPIPRNRINATKKKLEEQTKRDDDRKDRNALKSETIKCNEREEKSVVKKIGQVNNNEKESKIRVSPKVQELLVEKLIIFTPHLIWFKLITSSVSTKEAESGNY